MAKQKYHVDKTWDGYYGEEIHFDGEIEIDDEVIKAVDSRWKRNFYKLDTPQEVVEHIAFNMIVNDSELSQIDGFANFPNSFAKIVRG